MQPTAFVNGFVDGTDLVLLYRDEAGELKARRRPAEWSSFYRAGALSPAVLRDLRNAQAVAGLSEEGDFVRVKWRAEEWRREAHRAEVKRDGKDVPGFFASLGVEHFEADVDPIRRFFSETGARVAAPRRVYLDIETDSRVPPVVARRGKARVLSWVLVADDEPERDARDPAGLRVVGAEVLDEDSDEAERKLLEALWRAADPFDQFAAWYGDGFDFPIVRGRSQLLGARAKDLRRWLYLDHLVAYERMNRNAAESGDEKTSLRLNDVATELLGEGKHDFDASKTYEAWAAGGAERRRMVDYMVQDGKLLPRIERKTGYLALNAVICEFARCFQETRNLAPIPLIDGFLLRIGVERKTRFPSRARDEEEHRKFAGAFVLEPKVRGIRRNVHVFDFSGMYPSIMLTWNMSPETKRAVPVNGPIPPGHCRSPATRVGFVVEPRGIVPEALVVVGDARKQWQKKQAALPPGTAEWYDAGRRSNGYKVFRNSFYGATGAPVCRFHDRAVAESTSQTGAWLIQKTLAAAEERGWLADYGDTDSGFIEGARREEVAEFVRWLNAEFYPKLVADAGCRENHIEVAYEKEFERVVFVGKKRYIGVFRHYKWSTTCSCTTAHGDPGSVDLRTMTCRDCGKVWAELPPARGKPEVKGLEWKRGDSIALCRALQWKVIEKLMVERCEDPLAFVPLVEAARDHVLKDALAIEEVRQSQSLTKSLKEYEKGRKKKGDGSDAAEPRHVQVARVLRERGEQVEEGTKIVYYVRDASVSPMIVAPAADYAGDADRHYLWENLIYPATQRVLEAAFPVEPGMSVEDLRARDWDRFAKTRPRRARAPKAPEASGAPSPKKAKKPTPAAMAQVDLFAAPAPPPGDGPYRVEIVAEGEGEAARRLLAVKVALRKHPGGREVLVVVRLPSGESEKPLDLRVAVSPELVKAVAAAAEG